MNQVFNPTLVISIGPSGKKALDFLNDMLSNVPKHLRDVIYLYDINDISSTKEKIQNIIDERLLTAKGLNKLVDLGYKVRTEINSNVKLNIYLYWDVYGIDFPIKDLVEIIFNTNYGSVDKTKHSGVSFYLLPILDKEWIYEEAQSIRGIGSIQEVVDYLSLQDNMINIESKVYLTHPVSNDGLRIPKVELEYLCAIATYLSIIPSENPPLATYNKRLLKDEGNFKVGTIGISILTVFKEKIREEFNAYLINDLMDHAITFENSKDLSFYQSNIIIDKNNAIKTLTGGTALSVKNDIKLNKNQGLHPFFPNEPIYKRNILNYPAILDKWEERLKDDLVRETTDIIDKNQNKLNEEAKETIQRDLDSIVMNYSLKEGKNFLEQIQESINNKWGNMPHYMKKSDDMKENLKEKMAEYLSFKESFIKVAIASTSGVLLTIILICLFTSLSLITKAIISISILLVAALIMAYVFTMYDKEFMKFVDEYIDNVSNNQEAIINNHIGNALSEYYEFIIQYISQKIGEINSSINSCEQNKMSIKILKENKGEIQNLVTDLLDFEDRRKFYDSKKKEIPLIYSRFMTQIEDYNLLNKEEGKYALNNFTKLITDEYINVDFYEFMKIKWGQDKEIEIEKWIDKGIIKAKELLQYTQDYNLEEHRWFIGSNGVINEANESIMKKLGNHKVLSIPSHDVQLECMCIMKVSLGIELDKITTFRNVSKIRTNI